MECRNMDFNQKLFLKKIQMQLTVPTFCKSERDFKEAKEKH